MWEQHWVVTAREADTATEAVQTALDLWAPAEAGPPHRGEVRIWRGPDDLALAESVAEELSQIRQTALQATRQELSRRLHALSHRALGIPPRPGWVVLDEDGPRSPRPLDCRTSALRWVVTVVWPGDPPQLPPIEPS